MAPVTRSSLHGRPISNESSWQDLGDAEISPEQDTDELDEASDAPSVPDINIEDSYSEHGVGGVAGQRQQGNVIKLSLFKKLHCLIRGQDQALQPGLPLPTQDT